MSITGNIHEAKAQLSRLLERAHAGEETVVAKAGKPFARLMPLAPLAPLAPLVPVPAPAQRRHGRLKQKIDTTRFFDPLATRRVGRLGIALMHLLGGTIAAV